MTNRQIAQALGVSPATLSLVINNKPGISVATRSRVLERLEEMGLSEMVKARTDGPENAGGTLCFAVYKRHGEILDSHSFFLLLMQSIEARAYKHGYDLKFLCIDRRDPMPEQIERLRLMRCDGAVIFATEMLEDDTAFFSSLKMPYVLLDNDFSLMNLDCVAIDNALGTWQAAQYLWRMGHRQVGYLQSNVFINSFGEREAGFRQAVARLGLQLRPEHVFKVGYTEEGSYRGFAAILASGAQMPTALFADDDTIASGAIRALTEKGYAVPGDVSVMGFNDRPLCEKTAPRLTSIHVPKYAFGAMAIDLLVSRLRDAHIREEGIYSLKYRVGTSLAERDSVRRP